MYDVIVIGAGPVGSYAAYRNALAGLRVLLLEEHSAWSGSLVTVPASSAKKPMTVFPICRASRSRAELSATRVACGAFRRAHSNRVVSEAGRRRESCPI